MSDRTGAEARIAALIEPTLEAMGFRIVRLRLAGSAGRPVLQLMAERPDGSMSIDDCTVASRAVSAVLDVEDPIAGAYSLEVSSPGIDRPLVRLEDFGRHLGHVARIETKSLHDGRKRFKGRLAALAGDSVVIEHEAGESRIPLAEIAEAKLVLTDDLIRETLTRRKAQENKPPAEG